jgi:hypothetical protein
VLTISARDGAPLGKKQKRFNSLVKTAAGLRETLRAWRDADYELHRGAAGVDKLIAQRRANVRTLVLLFDGYATDKAFTKVDRAQLAGVAVKFARELLASQPNDAELKAVYNRLADADFDAERAEEEAEQSRFMQDVLEEHGLEFDKQFESLEELEAAARAQQAEREAEANERRARRKKSARQEAAEQLRTSAIAQAGKALQEIYRKLVRALHPDHEQDPVERARKTALMQQVNVAYERNDLLELLELQLRFEQIDSAHIGSLAEDRLDHFIKLLNDQVGQLRDELATVEHPFRIQLDVMPPRKLPVALVLAAMHDDAQALAHDIARMHQDLRIFADRDAMKAWLRDQRDRASRDARELQEMLAMMGSGQRRRRRG